MCYLASSALTATGAETQVMAIITLSAARAEIKANPGKFYTYILHRINGAPFYVGMGKGDRIAAHQRDAVKRRGHKHSIIRQILSQGGEVGYVISFFNTREDAICNERSLIQLYGRRNTVGGPLLNLTDGGEGTDGIALSEQQRKNISNACKRQGALTRDARQNVGGSQASLEFARSKGSAVSGSKGEMGRS